MSCRKTDLIGNESPTSSQTEEKFFNSNRSADAAEKSLVDYVKAKNDREHFVDKTVERIGYPRWNKMIMTTSAGTFSGKENSEPEHNTYYIPFVRDSQNFVNASMIIKTYPGDTVMSYTCDWQYAQRENNLDSYLDSAEYHAIFFMVLDKVVFGYNEFAITDDDLFRHDLHKPVKIRLDNFHVGGKNHLMEPFDVCQETTISWQDCPWNNTTCSGPNGTCDNCWQCTSSVSWTYCWTEWIETGGGGSGTGGPGGTGGGGSGSGSGGGSTPPDCEGPTVLRTNRAVPCDGGWNPIPVDDPPYGGYFDPVNFNGVWYTTTSYPGVNNGFHWKWWENVLFLQPYGGLPFGNWAINYLSLNPDVSFPTFMNWFFSTPQYTGGEDAIDPDQIIYDETVNQVPLPSLNDFVTNFPKTGTPGNYTHMPSPQVYQMVGGSLYSNHLTGNPNYQNACALRGSRALLYSGIHIPKLIYNSSQRTEKGSDNKNYILDAVSFNKFMISKFGDTPHKLEGADANDPQKVADLFKGKNGIYVIINNNSSSTTGAGYSGHVDLMQNGSCLGGTYTQPTGGVKSIRIWVLN